MKNDGNYRLKEFMKSPVGLTLGFLIIFFFVVLVVVTIIKINEDNVNAGYYWYSEKDEPSGTEIWFGSPTGGDGTDGIVYAGFEDSLIKNGVTTEQYLAFRNAVKGYAAENGIKLERVSYLKDSYKLKASYVFDFDVVLNVDEVTLGVEIDASAGWKNILGTVVKIYNMGGAEVYRLTVDETNICDYREKCSYIQSDYK